MPNLQFESEQLVVADAHIAETEKNIAHMRANLAASAAAGDDTELAERALQAAESGLRAFREHRAVIATTIEDIKAGRLPST